MYYKNIGQARDRLNYIRALNDRVQNLDLNRVSECKEVIWRSYQASTLCPEIAVICREPNPESDRFKSIGIRSTIDLIKFNAPNYYWKSYFSDVGRAIANGERKYLHQKVGHQVKGEGEAISRSTPDFRILSDRIEYLLRSNLDPDTLLAPVELMVDFLNFYDQHMHWSIEGRGQLQIGDCRLKIFWSHKYARLRSFIIFSSKAGTWHVVSDPDTDQTVTIALGESNQQIGRVEYWVETLARYQILRICAFSRVNLKK
jgi:hypothetical protein